MPDLSPRGGGEAEARAVLRSHGCCMEDYGFIGDADVIAEGRAEYDRLLDAYRSAVRAAYRDEVRAMVEAEMDRWIAAYPPDIDHLGKVQPAGETLRLMLPRVKQALLDTLAAKLSEGA